MRAATSARSMPERRSAQAVSATPPAPPLANSRVAACPASVISVLARRPRVAERRRLTARKSRMWPRNENASKMSASSSQRPSPEASRSQVSGRSASAGASSSSEPTPAAPAATRTASRRRDTPAMDGTAAAATCDMGDSLAAGQPE